MGGKSKSQTIGYKYFVGLHQILCHGPIDRILRLTVDDRIAWEGENTGTTITVNKPELFGGESREGGVSGNVDVEMGGPSQGQNAYLVSQLGSEVPGYRGVVGLVYNDFYWGNNPYLKPARARASRIDVRQNGIEQWYVDKANISCGAGEAIIRLEMFGIASDSFPNLGYFIGGFPSGFNGNAQAIPFADHPDLENLEYNIKYRRADGALVYDFYWRTPNAPLPVQQFQLRMQWNNGTSGATFRLSMKNDGAKDFTVLQTKAGSDSSSDPTTGLFPIPGGLFPRDWFFDSVSGIAPDGDMNFVHMIRECLTDPDWGMGYADADIDDTSFTAAADTLFNECFGGSVLWDREIPIEDFVNELMKHIDAVLYVSRTSGKFVLKLIRNDYDVGTLTTLDESNIVKVSKPTRAAFGELTNSVTVEYWDKNTGKKASLTVNDTALVQMQGAVINTSLEYKALTSAPHAAIVAQRDLRSLSNPLLSCTIYANIDARDLNIGSVFIFSWARWGVSEMVMRITGIAVGDGKNNQVRIECIQDVFDTPETAIVIANESQWTNPQQEPTAVDPAKQVAEEAPYLELVQVLGQSDIDSKLEQDNTLGYVLAAAGRPTSGINARMWTDDSTGYEEVGPLDFCPNGVLVGNLDKVATTLTLTNTQALSSVSVGEHMAIGDELMRIDTIDTGTGVITVGRGVMDTVPQSHSAGALAIFWDQFYGIDPTEYASGESIDVKITPVSGSGVLDLADATATSVVMAQRAFKPYPPGNLQINGDYYLDNVYGDPAELTISFAHRDRLQQTSGTLTDHTAGNIGPEAGQVYRLRGYVDDVLVETQDDVASSPFLWTPPSDGLIRVEVDSKRDGLYSIQAATHEFFYTGSDSRATEAGTARKTETGELRVTED